MLSIDITDKQVKIVRGSLSGSKIRVIQVETRDVSEGVMENGFITDVPMLASEIAEVLSTLDIRDKDTICSINSGMILYKELVLPKPKKLTNTMQIENMIQSNMNISTEYNISYSIVGETQDENNNPMIKVMATACPQRMVDGYIRLFSHLGLSLKSIYISNNCISRLITTSTKLASSMPLLLVQVDEQFLNLTLYDDSKVIISRYIKLDKSDYNYDDDYIYQAINDNIFHMVQFIESRPDARPLKEIMCYGHIPDFIRLTNAIQSFNIPCHILAAPANVVSFCDLNFSEYANAIGALLKTHKDYDQVNLLRSNAAKEKSSMSTYGLGLAAAVLGACLIVGGTLVAVNGISSSFENQAAAIRAEINSPELKARTEALNQKISSLEKIKLYSDNITVAKTLFDYMPKVNTEIVEKLEENLTDGMEIIDSVLINEYSISVSFRCKAQNQPSEYVEALIKQGYFESINYTGFSKEKDSEKYTFTLNMLLKGGNAVESE